MRNATFIAALTMLAACDGGLQFAHTSTLHQSTRGVALQDGDYARVGMSGTTCDVDTSYAGVSTDYDYAGSEDTIHDVENGKVVVTSDDGFHIVDRNPATMGQDQDIPASNAHANWTQAVATDDGAVAFGETSTGCLIEWAGYGDDVAATLKPSVCEATPAIAADPVTGNTLVGTADGISIATPVADTVEPMIDEGADLMVFDSSTELVYAAIRGETEVRAMDFDGNVVWRTDLMGAVTDIEDFGDRMSALVTVAFDDGTGSVFVLDGLTGEITSEMGTPDGNQQLAASEGGGQIALVREGEVHFYEVYTWLPSSLIE
ncbi:MAG: hypothetical protein EP330_01395 [Deltaproteobacteria bacterium]|nr:MAG: hypothetical protein EP330_01395 [Deltaproteobacteria bacterium]